MSAKVSPRIEWSNLNSHSRHRIGELVQVLDETRVLVVLSGSDQQGETLEARLPLHVNVAWLNAALSVAPVEVGLLIEGQDVFVWGVYPGPAHSGVKTELRLEGTRVVLEAGGARIELADNQIQVKAEEITSRATGEQWLLGGRIRFN